VNLLDYARILRRLWWIVIVGLVLGATGGFALARVTPVSYTVRNTMVISVIGDGTANALQSGNVFAMQRASTYANLATSREVLESAREQIGPGVTLQDLRDSVTAASVDQSGVIYINVAGPDPVLVQQTAEAVGDALSVVAKQTDTPGIQSTIRIVSVDPPSVPRTAAAPQPRISIAIGTLIGLLLGIGVIILISVIDTRIRSMGELPTKSFASATALPGGRKARDRTARREAIHRLRSNLRFGPGLAKTTAVFPVTPAGTEDVAWALAASLVEIGSRVVLVDIDPTPAAPRADIPADASGLTEVLIDEARLPEAIADVSWGLSYLGTGRTPATLPSLISGEAMPHLLKELGARFDHVILRCPPLLPHSETAVMAALAGANLLIVTAAHTTRAELLFALDTLDGVHAPSVSVVLDGIATNDLRAAVSRDAAHSPEFTQS
jgi:capsular polysaccharide biosynthesis protein/Mrp family chromosome partitioning ATPase